MHDISNNQLYNIKNRPAWTLGRVGSCRCAGAISKRPGACSRGLGDITACWGAGAPQPVHPHPAWLSGGAQSSPRGTLLLQPHLPAQAAAAERRGCGWRRLGAWLSASALNQSHACLDSPGKELALPGCGLCLCLANLLQRPVYY